jgi:tRNA-binding protein
MLASTVCRRDFLLPDCSAEHDGVSMDRPGNQDKLHPNTPKENGLPEISWEDFEKVDIRVGTVVEAEPFPEARKPSIKLIVDFGPQVGTKKTSAQLTAHYEPEGLVGRQVVAVVNFPPKRIAGFESEVLVLGVPDGNEGVVLLSPDHEVPPGGRMF